ncbi:MAG: phosphate acyltransferase PlsX [Fimbriimonas sp.]|nr:phosphate acyltransferase PlsX [Fimbriimonas sp.]
MTIALDVMGGDHAPQAIVVGALEAAPLLKSRLLLVGDEAKFKQFLPNHLPPNVELRHASQSVDMEEKPLHAYRMKKDSSLMVAARLVKDGEAEALVSAGNTGAASATSLLQWRQIHGIHRPAIASQFPSKHGGFVLLDAGASPDVDPEHLVEFAIMGRSYVQKLMGRDNPQVHLLNIGEEDGKGNAFAKQAHQLLRRHAWFAGNIEGKDMFAKQVDVIVCDAFVGNIVLKTCEGVAEFIVDTIRSQVPTHPASRLLYWPVRKVTRPLRKQMDYAEIGGSPLLGLNGLCMICHGRSNPKAIRNALLTTEKALERELVETIRKSVFSELGPVNE